MWRDPGVVNSHTTPRRAGWRATVMRLLAWSNIRTARRWARVTSSLVACLSPSIDRDAIRRELTVLGVELDVRNCGSFIDSARSHLLHMPRVKPVRPGLRSDRRLVLLDKDLAEADLPPPLQQAIEHAGGQLQEHCIQQGYHDLSAREVLQEVLPSDVVVPSAYENVGHVVHLNLRPEQLPYRFLIGQVLLDKLQPRVRTVVNKATEISSEFRNLPLELIAGEPDYLVTVQHGDAPLSFDYSKVYWSSRLHTEHERMASGFESGQVGAALQPSAGMTAYRGSP